MIEFLKTKGINIPEGDISKITDTSGRVLWQASKLPSEYQEVAWLSVGNLQGPYIDLGFSFDTKAKICVSQIIRNTNTSYLFGATEKSGVLRCLVTSPAGGAANSYAYGSNGSAYGTMGVELIVDANGAVNELELNLEKGNAYHYNRSNGYKSYIYTQQNAYTMTNNLYLFAQNYNGTMRQGGVSNLCVSAFKYYNKNDELICDLIPCYRKEDGEPGMYDLATKKFFTNAGTGAFTVGPEIFGGGTEQLEIIIILKNGTAKKVVL